MVSAEPRGRGLFVASLALSAVGLALLLWWLLSSPRSWWALLGGLAAAFAGASIAARARRVTPVDDEQRGGR